MRILTIIAVVSVVAAPASAQDRLTSPYRHQTRGGLRGLHEKEIAELKAGTSMGLARAAELNSYLGAPARPRRVRGGQAGGER